MHVIVDLLRGSLPIAASLCAAVLFPFVIHALLSSRVAMAGKALAVAAYGGLALLMASGEADPLEPLIAHAVAFGFITLGALAVWALALRSGRAPGGGAFEFAALCGALIVLPGAALPAPANFVAVAAGFELVFKAYSYRRDGWIAGARPSPEQALFFLLIDPVLCFPERARLERAPSLSWYGLSRCALGAGALFAHAALIALLLTAVGFAPPALTAIDGAYSASLFLVHYAGRFLAGYARHSGGASLAIGAMRLLGFELPERYHYAWLATSPADFWRRWNAYLGSWARRYVFMPAAGRLQRRLRERRFGIAIAKSAAVLAAFGLIGVLHDLAVYAQYDRWPLGGLTVFGLNGVAVLAWAAGEQIARTARRMAPRAARAPVALPGAVWSRLLFLPFLIATVWIAIPTMSTDFALALDDVFGFLAASGNREP